LVSYGQEVIVKLSAFEADNGIVGTFMNDVAAL
jgi:hypothetical protein